MKRYLCFLLALIMLCGLVMVGCNPAKEDEDEVYRKNAPTVASIVAPTTPSQETTVPTTEATEPPKPERPFSDHYPYLAELPAEACVFKTADPSAAFVQTIGDDGTFNIMEEVRAENGDVWGRLKSGIGWVNLSDPYCDGEQLPPVTISRAGKEVLAGPHQNAVIHTEYERKICFFAHETVTDLRIVFTNAGEMGDTVYTQDKLEPGTPLVVHLSYAGDFFGYYFYYTDANGGSHTNYIGESLMDGSITVTY